MTSVMQSVSGSEDIPLVNHSTCDSTSISSTNLGFNDDLVESSVEQQIRRGHELLAQKYKEPRNIGVEESRGLHHIEPLKKKHTISAPCRNKKLSENRTPQKENTTLGKVICSENRNPQQHKRRSLPRSKSTSPCPMRVLQLAAPPRRYCLETWRAKYNVLPPQMTERLKSHVYEQTPIVPLADAADIFQNEKNKKFGRRSPSQEKCSKKAASGAMLFEMRNFCVIFAHHVAQQLHDPFCVNLDERMKKLSDIVSTEIRKMMKDDDDLGNLNKHFSKEMHNEVSDRVSIWISNILERAARVILEEDLKAKNRVVRQSERKLKEDQVMTWVGTCTPSKTTDSYKDLEEEEGPILDFLDDVMDNVWTICTPLKRNCDQDSDSDGNKYNEPENDNEKAKYGKPTGSSEFGEHEDRSRSPESSQYNNYLESGKTFLSVADIDRTEVDTFYDSEENNVIQYVFEELLNRSTTDHQSENNRAGENNYQSLNYSDNLIEEKTSVTALVSNKLKPLVSDSESGELRDTSNYRAQEFITNLSVESPLFNQNTVTNKTSHEEIIHQGDENILQLRQKYDSEGRNINSARNGEPPIYESESSENNSAEETKSDQFKYNKPPDSISMHESNTVPISETDISDVNDQSQIVISKVTEISESNNQHVPEPTDEATVSNSDYEIISKHPINQNTDENNDKNSNYNLAIIKTAPSELSITDDDNKTVSSIKRYESMGNKAIVVRGEEDVDKYLDNTYVKPTRPRDDVFHILDDTSLNEEIDSSRKVKFSGGEIFKGSEGFVEQKILKEIATDNIIEDNNLESTKQILDNKEGQSQFSESDSRSSFRQHVHIFSEPKKSLISDMDDEWPAEIPKNPLRLSLSVSKSILSLGNIRESDEVYKNTSLDSDNIQPLNQNMTLESDASTLVSVIPDVGAQQVDGNYDVLLAISNEIHEGVSISGAPVKVPAKKLEPEAIIYPREQNEPFDKSDTESIELLITKRNLKNIQKQKEMFDKINIYAKIGVPEKAETIVMEGDELKIRVSRTKQAVDEKSVTAEKGKFKPKINYTVDPKNTPAWVQRSKKTKKEMWAHDISAVASVEIRDWAKVLDKFSLDINSWSQWVDSICHQVYDMTKENEVFKRPEPSVNESNTAQWLEFRERVEQQALQWRKVNLDAKRETDKLQSRNITHKKVISHQPRPKSESFVKREKDLINALDDIDKWSTWIHRTVVATEHVMKTDTRSDDAFQRWRRLRHTLNSESEAWQHYHEQTKRKYKSQFQFHNDNERQTSD